jgi:hypothetical protein
MGDRQPPTDKQRQRREEEKGGDHVYGHMSILELATTKTRRPHEGEGEKIRTQ